MSSTTVAPLTAEEKQRKKIENQNARDADLSRFTRADTCRQLTPQVLEDLSASASVGKPNDDARKALSIGMMVQSKRDLKRAIAISRLRTGDADSFIVRPSDTARANKQLNQPIDISDLSGGIGYKCPPRDGFVDNPDVDDVDDDVESQDEDEE